jgi:type II secretory pathway component PulF
MSPKKQVQLSSLCLAGMFIVIFAYGLLVFYIPRILSYYSETGEVLPAVFRYILTIVDLLEKFEIVIVPLLIFGFFFAVVWRIQSSIKCRKHNTLVGKSN